MHADLLLHNGTVLTLDAARPRAEALAITAGRVLAVGAGTDLAALRGPGTRVLDLEGGCALPAFTDTHCHLNTYGLSMDEIDCSPGAAPTIEAVKERIAAASRATQPGQWVQARGYDHTQLRPARHPTRWDLDESAPDAPVILRRRCGHVCVANSVALRMAGIKASGPEVAGGTIDRDPRGEPTGVLRERAQQLVRDLIPPPDIETRKRAILRAADAYIHEGFCAVHDAGGARMEELAAYRELAEEGRLPLRVTMMVRDPWIDHLIASGIATGFGSEWIKVGPYKVFSDGGIGPGTAAVSRPYRGEPENVGVPWYSEDELTGYAVKGAKAGFAVAIHAIGDAAVRMTINALARAAEEGPGVRYPHRIEHCVLPTAADIERMRQLGIAAAVQPSFLYALGDSWLDGLDPSLAERCYPLRSMHQAGLLVTGGSDCPVVLSHPLRGMQTAIIRRTQAGAPVVPGEALDPKTALRLYTDLPPRLMREESDRGRLMPGMAADVVVLSGDPLLTPADEIADLQVLATITGGHIRQQTIGP
ncbi:MAG: amidohydrolase [Armatimonadota bacterium]